MKKIILLAFVVAFVCSSNLAFASKKNDIQKKTNLATKKVNTTERSKEADRWLFSSEEVAKKTQNEDAKVIVSYLRDSFYLGIPIFHEKMPAFRMYSQEGKEIRLCMIPLLESDRKISNAWREVFDSNLAACFVPDPRQPHLILKDSGRFSKTWQGLILIHEGSHALAFAANVFQEIEDPLMRRVIDELCAYSLEIELVEKIGGEMYQAFLKEEIERIGKDFVEKKNILLPDYSLYEERHEKIFGKSCSKLESAVRGSVFWINAVFRLIDKTYNSEEEREKHKVDFLYSSYKNGNME